MSLPRLLSALVATAVLFLLMLAAPTTARAATSYPYECRLCKDIPQTGLTQNSYCAFPASGANGFLGCSERWTIFGELCIDGKTDCIYMCVGPGCPESGLGGPSGGGGGSGECTSTGGFCPPECFSCGGQYY